MHQLIVRRLDRRLVKALKERAASHGRSAEAEHRAILESVLGGSTGAADFKTFLKTMPGTPALRIRRSRDRGRRITL